MKRKLLLATCLSLAVLAFCPGCSNTSSVAIKETPKTEYIIPYPSSRPIETRTEFAYNSNSYRGTRTDRKLRHKSKDIPKTFDASVRFEMSGGICSSTAVGERVLLTAAHCVDLASNDATVDGRPVKIEKVITDKNDHAIVILFDDGIKFEKIAKLGTYPSVGENIFYWGNIDGINGLLRKGYVAGKFEDGTFVVDSNTWSGDSGSGIFDQDGRLIGVVSSIMGKSIPNKPGLSYKFMLFFEYTFKEEDLKGLVLKYDCDGCMLFKPTPEVKLASK